jgi:hypothetical protein
MKLGNPSPLSRVAIFAKPRFYPGVALRMAAGRVFPEHKIFARSDQCSLLDI